MRTRERTCDQDPGAAQRSTTRETLLKRSNSIEARVSDVLPVGIAKGPTLVKLEELEGAAGAPSLFFCETVVSVALVFGGFAHGSGGLWFVWCRVVVAVVEDGRISAPRCRPTFRWCPAEKGDRIIVLVISRRLRLASFQGLIPVEWRLSILGWINLFQSSTYSQLNLLRSE